MFKEYSQKIYNHFARRTANSDDELSIYLLMLICIGFAFLMHVLLLPLSLIESVMPQVVLNIASLLILGLCFFLARKGRHLTAVTLISIDVLAYTFGSLYLVGNAGYTILYFYILATMHLLVPYTRTMIRTLVVIIIWLAMVIALLWFGDLTPLHTISQSGTDILRLLNINMAFLALIIGLSINNVIRRALVHFNSNRIEEFKSQAYTDPLTGLYNRRYADRFFDSLRQGSGLDRRWCVAMLDIDDFKKINDTYGHAVGDIVLRSIADQLCESLRKSDIIFRWGGEEFLILLEGVGNATAFIILEKIRQVLAAHVIYAEGQPLRLTVTIGAEAINLEDIKGSIDRCDKKMYEGKRRGKDVVVI